MQANTVTQPMSELEAEHEALLSFMYICPTGLIQMTGDGTINMINPHAMSLLLPVTCNGLIENLFDVLDQHDPELRTRVHDFTGPAGPVLRGHRIHLPPVQPKQPLCVLSCTLLMINRQCLLVLLQDISSEVILETKLAAARQQELVNERLVSLGRMAGSLAHEINNPLAIIHALSTDLIDNTAPDEAGSPKVTSTAAEIMAMCERTERIIHNLLCMARDSTGDPSAPVCLADIIANAKVMCASFFGGGAVELIVNPVDPTIMLSCREVQIAQILVNLLQNGFYAAKAGSRSPRVQLAAQRQGSYVEIRVTDSGPGVSPDIRDRIMEPFFTTKPVGEGTGLGLSVAGEIARAHGGRICLDEAHTETCFVLTLAHCVEHATL